MEYGRADHIAFELEEQILKGEFVTGDRLDEIKLAERFSVSRTPIREALHKLVQSGLIEQIPRRGAFVRQVGPEELVEMFEVMSEMEALAGRLAARRISEAGLGELSAANAACEAAVRNRDAEGYHTANEMFHKLLYKFCGNGFLRQEAERLHRRLRPYRRLQLKMADRMQHSLDEHLVILEALKAGDSVAASEAMRAHVALQGARFHHIVANMKAAAE